MFACLFVPNNFVGFVGARLMDTQLGKKTCELRHDKTNKMTVRPAKTQISLGIRLVWSESLLSAWRKVGSLATYWAHSEDTDKTGRMPRLIEVFAGRTFILLVLSCRGSMFTLLFVEPTNTSPPNEGSFLS